MLRWYHVAVRQPMDEVDSLPPRSPHHLRQGHPAVLLFHQLYLSVSESYALMIYQAQLNRDPSGKSFGLIVLLA